MLILLQKCISYHETKQASKFQSDPSYILRGMPIGCWFEDRSLIVICIYLILHKFWSVSTSDILGIGLL